VLAESYLVAIIYLNNERMAQEPWTRKVATMNALFHSPDVCSLGIHIRMRQEPPHNLVFHDARMCQLLALALAFEMEATDNHRPRRSHASGF
jgi:hypothetical protein